MISAYNELISFGEGDIEFLLERICIIEIFRELIDKYRSDKPLLKCIIKYIVMAYSKESDKVIIGMDWHKNKKRIYEEAMLPPNVDMMDSLVYLKDETVLSTVKKWLDFQNDEVFTELRGLKDLIVELQIATNSPIKKSSGEIDYQQKYLNATYVRDLRDIVKALESELMQNDSRFKESVREVRSIKSKHTLGVEKYAI